MLFDLIATVAAGFAGAGIVLLLRSLSGRRVPRSAIPIVAGGMMIAYAIWSEYSWFDRTYNALPQGFEVVTTHSEPAFWRPWTYAFPFVQRFSAVDVAAKETRPEDPGLARVRMVFITRWGARAERQVLVDCVAGRQADGEAPGTYDAEGRPTGAQWHALAEDHPLREAVCEPG